MDIMDKRSEPQGGDEIVPDPHLLIELLQVKMPFGKYAGRVLIDLPEEYLGWFSNKGWPEGKLGRQMALVYEMQMNGLEKLLDNLR